jgi:hypothetical protein
MASQTKEFRLRAGFDLLENGSLAEGSSLLANDPRVRMPCRTKTRGLGHSVHLPRHCTLLEAMLCRHQVFGPTAAVSVVGLFNTTLSATTL